MQRDRKDPLKSQPVRTQPAEAGLGRRGFLAALPAVVVATGLGPAAMAQGFFTIEKHGITFRRIRTQFIAALAAPDATAGDNAEHWGLWREDPGPRGVKLSAFERLVAANGLSPARWQFDSSDWWLEEHGLIMEQPDFPLPAGQYLVTGDREVVTVLTVQPPGQDGRQAWELADDATVYDVTHLRCRSARYTPLDGAGTCSPQKAQPAEFPVSPGATMPPVTGCAKQDYAVLFVIGMAVK